MDTTQSAEIKQSQPVASAMTTDPKSNGASKDKAAEAAKARARRKRNKRIIWGLIIVLIAGGAGWYFFLRKEPIPAPVIRYTAIERGEIVQAVTATGTIQATTTVQVGTQVSGTIRALYADFNSKVKKGQLIAVLDPTFYQAAIKQAEANYQKVVADRDHAKLDAGRADALFQKELLSKAEHDAAVATLAVANASVQQSEAALEQAKVNLGYTQIHAPIDGTVVSRNVDVGQTVAASLNAPVIFVIAQDLAKMQVQAAVDEADIGGVKAGQEVVFTVDAFGEEKFHGVVNSVRLNATITQNVVNYTVIIDAENKDLKLLPSMTATATIINQSKKDVFKVPMAALTFTPPEAQPGAGSGRRQGNRGGGGGGKRAKDTTAGRGTIYVKAPSKPGDKPAPLQLVHVQTGISDGLFIEVTPVETINLGDSVAIGSSTPGAATGGAPGASPFGTQPGSNNRSGQGMRRL